MLRLYVQTKHRIRMKLFSPIWPINSILIPWCSIFEFDFFIVILTYKIKQKFKNMNFAYKKTKNRQKNANFSSNSVAVQVEELLLLSTIFSFNFRHFSWVLSIENNLHFGAWPKSEKALKFKKKITNKNRKVKKIFYHILSNSAPSKSKYLRHRFTSFYRESLQERT